MTADLSPDTRRMLAGVLGMLGSDHVGERDVTARLAEWIVRSAGLTWNELIAAPRLEARPEPPRPDPPPPSPDWRELAHRCSAHPRWLSEWEQDFVAGLSRWARLSLKQAATLDRIAPGLTDSL
jgi:hypothetical protein